MQIPASGRFPRLIKVISGITSSFGHFLGHLTATTKAWQYGRYEDNRNPPFHRLSAARGVSNMQIPASGWFPRLIKVITSPTSAFGHFLGHLAATTKAWQYGRYEDKKTAVPPAFGRQGCVEHANILIRLVPQLD